MNQPAVFAVANELANGRHVGGDDRNTGGHGLDDLQRRAALQHVTRRVGERRNGDRGVLQPRRERVAFELEVPDDALVDAKLFREPLVTPPRFGIARTADDQSQ